MTNNFVQMLVSREMGGAALTALHLAEFVKRKVGASHILVPGAGPAAQQAQNMGLPVHHFDLSRPLSSGKVRAGLGNWKIGRQLRCMAPGLVHVHGPCYYGALRHGLRWSGLKQVVHVQIEEDSAGMTWALRSPPDLIITCARFLVDHVRRCLPGPMQDRQKIVAVPNAVDIDRFHPAEAKAEAKRKMGAPLDQPLVLMLANLAPHKGQETMLRALALLKKQGLTATLWLAGEERGGEGAYTAKLRELIAALELQGQVHLLGQRQDAPDLLRAADFFVLPSTHEGLPLSLLEAQATKVLVLAAPTAGIPEVVIDGETGVLVPADDPAGYAARLAALWQYPDCGRRMIERAYTRVTTEYTWKAFCERVGVLYKQLLATDEHAAPVAPTQNRRARGPWPWLRSGLRRTVFHVARRVLESDDGKALVAASLEGLLRRPTFSPGATGACPLPPYHELGQACQSEQTCRRDDIVFITARFRSGSTLLWNLFREAGGFTSYYEPLNERRWFDPAARGTRTDATHRNVSDYWTEYDGLEELGQHYREDWIRRNLLMDADSWDPALQRYIETLIARAPGRPVLQFNRVDFRLPWLRSHFPNAKLIHLYRHPRDQWCSALMDPRAFPKEGTMKEFAAHDHYYQSTWAADLRYHFPFLDPAQAAHPYQVFYYIWKLSYWFGRRHSHYSLAFEDLVQNPDTRLTELFDLVQVKQVDFEKLKKLMVKPALGKWKEYADDSWFRQHETICENVLADFLPHD